MAQQLGIVIMPNSAAQIGELARAAEDGGFAGACMPELTNDGLMCCYVMAQATKNIRLITWIVNVYFRHPWLCAAAATMVQEVSGGRLTLGLGVSHRPFMQALGIDMGNARDKLRSFTVTIRKIFSGEMNIGVPARKPKTPIPIYYGALALETARLAYDLLGQGPPAAQEHSPCGGLEQGAILGRNEISAHNKYASGRFMPLVLQA